MKNQDTVILNLAEADCEGIGNKARRLAKLIRMNPSLFSIPVGLVLLPEFSVQQHATKLTDALQALGSGPFAVRSCGQEEDGADESMAGKYHTELFIAREGIGDAVNTVRASYGENLNTSAVLIQKMITPDYAGVLFSRSPENYGLASCEYSEGTADALVSGKVEPQHVEYGRYTGNLYPDASDKQDIKQMLSLVFLVGMIIESRMGRPQDIEWAYVRENKQLFILQSRDITSALYDPHIAREQEKSASAAAGSSNGKKGKVVFQNAAVREVVLSPTRLTRSLVEQLYAPGGSLGRAFDLLQLPCPRLHQPYVVSLFGQLYENKEVEKKLFGFRPALLWANRRLKKRVQNEAEELQAWLTERIENFPQYPHKKTDDPLKPEECAHTVIQGVRIFIEQVYPVAYVATLLAQLAEEETSEASLTGQMMRDLSRLHHTGAMEEFVRKWGLRSGNDYELSEPRFCESAEYTLEYAQNFAHFSWEKIPYGKGFTHLKEFAKDRAIRWLFPLRQDLLALEKKLNLTDGIIFHLDLTDIEALATGKSAAEDIPTLCKHHAYAEKQWATISLGDALTLETLERLVKKDEKQQGLFGKMVSSRKSFSGPARHVASTEGQPLKKEEIIIARHLEPELVGLFPDTAGCLADMGGSLSHAAIVARELDYPILVLAGCSSTIHDGDLIEISADGAVTVIRKNKVL